MEAFPESGNGEPSISVYHPSAGRRFWRHGLTEKGDGSNGATFKISEHDEGRRIDKIIRKKWPDLPLSAMMELSKRDGKSEGRKVECSAVLPEAAPLKYPGRTK